MIIVGDTSKKQKTHTNLLGQGQPSWKGRER
jgi:hypothetical protein